MSRAFLSTISTVNVHRRTWLILFALCECQLFKCQLYISTCALLRLKNLYAHHLVNKPLLQDLSYIGFFQLCSVTWL